jgi:predicted CoA-substrate-specific enzyme activase
MITGGVDVGIEYIKAVVLADGKVVARASALSGGAGRGASAERVWAEALGKAKISASEVSKVVATGQGKQDAHFAQKRVTEPVADAAAARFLFPSAASVVDVGADQVRVVTLGPGAKITEVVMNQKCYAGIGLFLKSMARTLEMNLEAMSRMAPVAASSCSVNDTCCVFAELDAVALIHANTPKQEIVQAVYQAMATRINSILNDKIVPEKNNTVLIGGVTKNTGLVNALKKRSGINFLIPEFPEYAGAVGAALLAAQPL